MNNDLISRSALKKLKVYSEERREYVVSVFNIDNAPTEAVDNYSMGYQDGVRKVLSERPKGEWIPVSERLPEKSGDYLVRPSDGVLEDYSDFSEVMIMPYESDSEAFGWWSDRYDPVSLGYLDSDFVEFEVIAWQPLPEPYKEADNDKVD